MFQHRWLVPCIAFLMGLAHCLTPAPLRAQPAGGAAPAVAAKTQLDLGYVTRGTMLAAIVHPARVLKSPQWEMLPLEVVSAAGKKELGIDPLDVERVLLIAEAPDGDAPPRMGVVLQFHVAVDLNAVLPQLVQLTEPGTLHGKSYRRAAGPMALSLFPVDAQTLIVAHDDLLQRMLANHANPQPGEVSQILGAVRDWPDAFAVLTLSPIRPLLNAQLQQVPVPPPFAGAARLPDLLTSVGLKLNLTGDPALALALRARDEASAQEVEQIIDQLLAFAAQMAAAQVAQQAQSQDPVEQAMAQYVQRISRRMMDSVRPTRTGDRLVVSISGQGTMPMASSGVLVALLLPAVQAAREAARRTQSMNNLKQIGLALHIYHDANRNFPPPAKVDAQGRPLLSWRVAILPYLDQQALYEQFRLDEPWDSEHNRQLIPRMPPVYANPSAAGEPGKAHYLGSAGEGMLFGGDKARRLADITDGTSNTVAVVEVDPQRAVIWTKPDDWQPAPNQPLAGLGKAHPGGFLALLADGSVRFLSSTIDPQVFQRLLTISGGEVVREF